MAVTSRDKEILDYVEKYGFITIGETYNIFMSERRYGYDIARKRLQALEKQGHLNSYQNLYDIYSSKVYYEKDKYKKPGKSMILVMDVYAELKRLGADILYFHREQEWLNKEYKSDAFVIFKLDKYIYSSFVEVLRSTSSINYGKGKTEFEQKYNDILACNEWQELMQQITNTKIEFNPPSLLLVDEVTHKEELQIEGLNIVSVNFNLDKLSKIFI